MFVEVIRGVYFVPQTTTGITSRKGEMYFHDSYGVMYNDGSYEYALHSSDWPTFYVENDNMLIDVINSAAASGGGVICLKASVTCTTNLTIPSNTILTAKSWSNTLTISGAVSILMPNNDSQIRNLSIVGVGASSDLINVQGSRCTVENCKINGSGIKTTGLWMAAPATNCLAIRCVITGCITPYVVSGSNTQIDTIIF